MMKIVKTQKNLKRKLTISLGILLFLGMFFSCKTDQEEVQPEISPDLSEEELDQASKRMGDFWRNYDGNPIQLTGTLNYFTYAIKGKDLLQDVNNDCIAVLDLADRNNVTLNVTENAPGETRIYELIGKITRFGLIRLRYHTPFAVTPDGDLYITDIIQGHSGCTLYGPGIADGTLVYNGYFNGQTLCAPAIFMSKCDVEWPANDLFETPVEGPVFWRWKFDLEVD
ncbi:MAG: hypothetical protein KFF73_14935 [Cyclobacteriaceae bacterium]|nr:hypothetical protein [Cyclobacteriaceae bacterium]